MLKCRALNYYADDIISVDEAAPLASAYILDKGGVDLEGPILQVDQAPVPRSFHVTKNYRQGCTRCLLDCNLHVIQVSSTTGY